MTEVVPLGPYTTPGLGSLELGALRSPTAVRAYLSYVRAGDTIATGLVGALDANEFNADTYIGLNITSPVGWANVKPGMTLEVDDTAYGGHNRGTFRIRSWNGGTNVVSIGQKSLNDTGLLNQGNALPAFNPGFFVTVRNDYNIWQAFPRISPISPPTFYKDYNQAFANDTLSPPGIVNIGEHRSAFVDAGQTYATMSFTVNTFMWAGSTTPWNFTWTLPAGATLTVGSLTSTDSILNGAHSGAAITVRFPVGVNTITLTTTCTNSNSAPNTTTSLRYIFVHDGTPQAPGPTYPPIPVTNVNYTADNTGTTVECELLTADYGTLTDGALVNYFEVPYFGSGSVPTLSTNMTGWVTNAKLQTEGGVFSGTITIKGPSLVMQAIGSHSQRFDIATTPTDWQHVIPQLCTAEYGIFYMLQYHEPNFLKLFDFWVYWPPQSSTYVAIALTINAGNEMGQLQELAKKQQTECGCDSTGAMWIRPNPALMFTNSRTAQIVFRDNLTPDLYSHVDWTTDKFKKVGTVLGEAFGYFGANDPVTNLPYPQPFLNRAPGTQYGQGYGEERLESQINPTDSAGFDWATGALYAYRNSPYPNATFKLPYNRHVYEPAQWSVLTATIPANISPTGAAFTSPGGAGYGNWIPLRLTKTINEGGVPDISLETAYQTSGLLGTDITPPPPIITGGGGTTITPPPPPPPPPPTATGCHCFDLTSSLYGWSIMSVLSDIAPPGAVGWVANTATTPGYLLFGQGVKGGNPSFSGLTYCYAAIRLTFPATSISEFDFNASYFGMDAFGGMASIRLYLAGTMVYNADVTGIVNNSGNGFTHVLGMPYPSADTAQIVAAFRVTNAAFDGSQKVLITYAKICASGTDHIIGGTNC